MRESINQLLSKKKKWLIKDMGNYVNISDKGKRECAKMVKAVLLNIIS